MNKHLLLLCAVMSVVFNTHIATAADKTLFGGDGNNRSDNGGGNHNAGTISTTEIVQNSLSFSCFEWRVVGICVWLTCGLGGCSTSTSVKYGHYIPDTVVSSYGMTGKNPWRDWSQVDEEASDTIADAVASAITSVAGVATVTPDGMGALNSATNPSKRPTTMQFFNADVIGHPANVSDLFGDMALCTRSTMAMMPYYQSVAWDASLWRTGGLEPMEHFLESHTFGLREVMNAQGVWGNVYPRQAYLAQPDERKAAAVIAQRAADIAYSAMTAHVYVPIPRQTGNGNWSGWGMIESDVKNHKWQALYPKPSNACYVFPNPELELTPADTVKGYVWALWRPYSCCQKAGQRLISHTPDGFHRGQ